MARLFGEHDRLKFVVDGMLGSLARWLRMMGHNVEYSNNMDDAELLMLAKNENRVLLTRDFQLYQQATAKGTDVFYVEGQREEERLAEVAGRYGVKLEIDMTVSRCPKCNTRVEQIPKEDVKGKVEESTYRYYAEFWQCPKCGQIYWQGAHWTKIREMFDAAENNLKSVKEKGA